ncbi:MAG: hypothetical protein LBG98_02070 [Puniceicoccales bacterium]|nr:hypothetical protein [Puniceicoccales bacterium]
MKAPALHFFLPQPAEQAGARRAPKAANPSLGLETLLRKNLLHSAFRCLSSLPGSPAVRAATGQ